MTDKKEDINAESGEKPWLKEVVRELTLTGLAAFFMTEDSVRNYLKELKLPKEMAGLFIDNISKRKDDLYGLLAKEFGRVLTKIDVSAELGKFLEKHQIHVEAKLSFEPKHGKKESEEKS